MTRKTRTILFLFLLILFLTAAPLTVLYCLGWRFDWETKKVIQPGIFYFKAWPKSVQIYLDDKFKKKTDFFFGSVLIENLLPKKYNVKIKKEGFHTWEKTLEIEKRKVTETKNIVLVPKDPKFKLVSKEIKDFFFSPDGKKIILKEENKDSENPGWSLKLFELEKSLKSHLIEEEDISKKEVQLIDLEFSLDSKKVLLEVGVKERLMFYLLELDKAPPLLTLLDFLDPDVEKVYFNSRNSQKLFVLKEGELTEADLVKKKTSLALLENIIALYVLDNAIYHLDSTGFLFKTNFSFERKEKLNIIPFSLKEETKYEITVSNSDIVLKENNVLYVLEEDRKSFQKIFEPVENFRFSPDLRKMIYFNNYEIWVLFLEQEYSQPQKEAGEQLFITRFSEKIDEAFWYTSHYLIFNVGEKIKIAEIDDRDRINITELIEFKNPEIFWNQDDKKLYVLSEENLFSSEKLVP